MVFHLFSNARTERELSQGSFQILKHQNYDLKKRVDFSKVFKLFLNISSFWIASVSCFFGVPSFESLMWFPSAVSNFFCERLRKPFRETLAEHATRHQRSMAWNAKNESAHRKRYAYFCSFAIIWDSKHIHSMHTVNLIADKPDPGELPNAVLIRFKSLFIWW